MKNQEPVNPQSQEPTSQSSNRTQITFSKAGLMKVGVFLLVALIGVGGFFVYSSMKADTRFLDALTACTAVDASGITLAEDGQSLNFNGKGDDDLFGGDFSDLECIIEELGAPSTVMDRMLRTNSLMGVQDSEWDGISISWTYAPANGLDANFDIVK